MTLERPRLCRQDIVDEDILGKIDVHNKTKQKRICKLYYAILICQKTFGKWK